VTRILWVNPGEPPANLNEEFRQLLTREKEPSTEVDVVSTGRGPRDLEYRYYEALVIPDTLHRLRQAEKEGYEGAVIGCFYDPGVEEARELTNLIVIGPGEASMRLASVLGHTFSVIVGREKWIPQMRENVVRHGMEGRFASFRALDLPVCEMRADEAETARRIERAARAAVEEDGAEVIILGCTMEYGFYQDLQQKLRVPVVDPVLAAFKTAEWLVGLKNRYGWSHSKVRAYEPPPEGQIRAWDLARQYRIE
jgi:allantoin racemase